LELTLKFFGWGDPPQAILDSDIEYYAKPSSSYYRYGNNIIINSYGMRSRELHDASADTLHISLLGDSVVYGNHFLDQANTIASKLENKMHKNLELDTLVSAIAASSWGPQNILNYFNKIGPFSGSYAIVVQSGHDKYDIIDPSLRVKPPYRLETSNFAISDFVLRIMEWANRKHQKNKINSSEKKKIQKITFDNLNQLIVKLKDNYKHVALYYHVTKPELISESLYISNGTYFKEIALNNNIDFIDSFAEYNQKCSKNIYRDHIHLNDKGTSCVSRVLFDWIKKNHLKPH